MILDADKRETDALLDLLDAAVKARGLNMAVWASHWALKVKAAEAAAAKPQLVVGTVGATGQEGAA